MGLVTRQGSTNLAEARREFAYQLERALAAPAAYLSISHEVDFATALSRHNPFSTSNTQFAIITLDSTTQKSNNRQQKEENMPLWDSVQRGLEKASQEASRIARIQRLRTTIDNLSRQMNTQSNNLINRTMELFINGQLTQSELLPFCQELVSLKQQINDAQNELRFLQANQPPAPSGQIEGPGVYPPTMPAGPYTPPPMAGGYELPPTVYAPPPPGFETYPESGSDVTPPPPPGVEPLTISAISTVLMNVSPAPQPEKRPCPACQAEVQPEHAFCHNCGASVQASASPHLPTVRAGTPESAYHNEQVTARAEETSPDNIPPPPVTS